MRTQLLLLSKTLVALEMSGSIEYTVSRRQGNKRVGQWKRDRDRGRERENELKLVTID